jgi:hypothetical protein
MSGSSSLWRRLLRCAWIGVVLLAAVLWLQPIGSKWTRAATVALFFLVWGGALILWWRRRWVRVLCLGAVALVPAISFWPTRPTDPAQLRGRYVEALRANEGTRYVWGGENRLGIDCSGLVRRGLIDALFRQGLATANPGLIRQSFALRWFDCSARALGDEYRHQTRRLFSVTSIRQLDHTRILPGDFAVTSGGIHTLAYLGGETWIQADPGAGCVIRAKAAAGNPWLSVPVVAMRWRALEAAD